ncbi:DUF1707 domain-containing protein [Amycolatopsis sp. NPDC059027]|uniref:DUF1707 SHOCT-like domain-containing protein n=1 Tax=unclassified Amycolatopsis TaxID=2618356 RepID=UPI00366BD867
MDEKKIPARLRAADSDRERVATVIQAAGAEGRLGLDEVEERLSMVYAARYTDELGELTADLPGPEPKAERRGGPPLTGALRHPALRVHLAAVVALSVLLVIRWAMSGVPFFWPLVPMFWLVASFFAHARIRGFRQRRRDAVPY